MGVVSSTIGAVCLKFDYKIKFILEEYNRSKYLKNINTYYLAIGLNMLLLLNCDCNFKIKQKNPLNDGG